MDRKLDLGAQAAKLAANLLNREQRRQADKAHRHEAAEAKGEYGSAYDAPPAKRQAVGGGGVSQIQKLAEIAQLSRPAEVFRCELCQATFSSQVGLAQHDAGPVHRKAVERQQQQALAAQRRAVYQDMTEAALGAAAWQSTHGSGSGAAGRAGQGAQAQGMYAAGAGGGGGGGGGGRGGRGAGRGEAGGRGRGRGPPPEPQPARPRTDVMSHAEVVAAATRTEEPLTINGWAPPTIALPAQPPPAAGPPKQPGRQPKEQQPAHDREEGRAGQGSGGVEGGPSGPGAGGSGAQVHGGAGAGGGLLLGLAYGSDDDDGEEGGRQEGGQGGGKPGGSDSDSEDSGRGREFTGSFF